MSSAAQIQRVRSAEQRYPSDLLHNGHQYVHGWRRPKAAFTRAARRLRSDLRIRELEAVEGCVLRIHRVER
jgi:hypothetical protein